MPRRKQPQTVPITAGAVAVPGQAPERYPLEIDNVAAEGRFSLIHYHDYPPGCQIDDQAVLVHHNEPILLRIGDRG